MEKRRVLIVDDDEINSGMLGKRLEKRNFVVKLIHDGYMALESLESKEEKLPELILLDIMMPNISGIEMLKKLREKYAAVELPIIMLTAKTDTEDIVEAFKLGANDYLTKPVNISVAIARINTQMSLLDLAEENLQKNELETLNAMIVTYNHEINNPLTIALGNMGDSLAEVTEQRYVAAVQAMKRIANIVKKIDKVATGKLEKEEYGSGIKMFKIKD